MLDDAGLELRPAIAPSMEQVSARLVWSECPLNMDADADAEAEAKLFMTAVV